MNIIERQQFVKVINESGVSFYPIDDIYAVSHLDNFYLVINYENGPLVDILTGDVFVSENKKIVVEPFRDYILNNISLFNKDLVDVALDRNCDKEVSFNSDLFVKCFDKMKNRVFDQSNKIVELLEDGTIIEQNINFCDRSSILDKLLSLGGVSEEDIISLLCDIDVNFETIKTIVKSTDGKILTDSFVIKSDDYVIVEDKCQLYYYFDILGFDKKKVITCQSDMNKYENKEFSEGYLNELKISFEKEKNNTKIYR